MLQSRETETQSLKISNTEMATSSNAHWHIPESNGEVEPNLFTFAHAARLASRLTPVHRAGWALTAEAVEASVDAGEGASFSVSKQTIAGVKRDGLVTAES